MKRAASPPAASFRARKSDVMSTSINSQDLSGIPKVEFCPNCGREWPAKFGVHGCNFSRRYVHNNSIVVEPGAELLISVRRITDRLEHETCRSAESANLAGEEPPYRRVLGDIDTTIGFLKHYRAEIQRLAHHEHDWDSTDYCSICGTDGRA